MSVAGPILEIEHLDVTYPARGWRGRPNRAVQDVSFTIAPGETVGLVGESGSGKSTIARAVLGLAQATAGRISFEGRDITHATGAARRALASELSVVFQDPYSSLNPALSIGTTLREPLLVRDVPFAEAKATIGTMVANVGLPADAVERYPRQFSGGQRQRIAIARALAVRPKLLICDEPVSALDLSIQAQIINLLADLHEQFALAMLFVAHDLSVVRHIADRTAVLLRGQIMEIGPAELVYSSPKHPYTAALSASALDPDPVAQRQRRTTRQSFMRREPLPVPAEHRGKGCPFAARCPHAMDVCVTTRPELRPAGEGVAVACHLYGMDGRAPALQSVAMPA